MIVATSSRTPNSAIAAAVGPIGATFTSSATAVSRNERCSSRNTRATSAIAEP